MLPLPLRGNRCLRPLRRRAGSPPTADIKAVRSEAEEQPTEPGQDGTYKLQRQLAGPVGGLETPVIPAPSGVRSICLPDVLALAGVENPVIRLAEQAVQSSLALQMQARVLLLPDLNVGGDFNNHTGPLQTAAGYIRSLDRQSAYLALAQKPWAGGRWPIPASGCSPPWATLISSRRWRAWS